MYITPLDNWHFKEEKFNMQNINLTWVPWKFEN